MASPQLLTQLDSIALRQPRRVAGLLQDKAQEVGGQEVGMQDAARHELLLYGSRKAYSMTC